MISAYAPQAYGSIRIFAPKRGAQELVDFRNFEDYKEWRYNLESRDLSRDCDILPARATLRAVPLMAGSIETGPLDLHTRVFSMIFNAGIQALVAPLDEDPRADNFRGRSGAAALAYNAQALSMDSTSMTATFMCRAIGCAAWYHDARAFGYAEYAINSEAGNEVEARLPAHDQMWWEISADATAIEERGTRLALASRPLWSSPMPEHMARQWTSVKHHLSKLDEATWTPVIEWYEARLRGDLIDTDPDQIEKILQET